MTLSDNNRSSRSKLIFKRGSALKQSKLSNSESSRRKNRLRKIIWSANKDWRWRLRSDAVFRKRSVASKRKRPSAAWMKRKSAWLSRKEIVFSAKKSKERLRLSQQCNSKMKKRQRAFKNNRSKKPFASLRSQSASASSKKLYATRKRMSRSARWRSSSDSARRKSWKGRDSRMKRMRGRRTKSA